ncbi:hypothetical protein CLV51_105360 [Chitinophaga niastensis]|uniref:Uncharacterized protein n=1 Tax=Chitinophaga niastensis TaxID=536980 RepID=A0A2P8HFJ6_CHINA|nr:hypothetical protein [Chitinophaga niastensis]PSL44985.1 hypothetical protein CLV51_105360 [Chitinophaga niastensis]
MPNSHTLIPNRIVIYAKDIRNITGRSERTARKMLQQIREANGKKKGEFVTVMEFCSFTGLEEEIVSQFLAY